ncbi:MAG: sensor histidine kinase [Rubrivivax sp.]|nr:sensor histidine kinase [Rubrivivax sp.]
MTVGAAARRARWVALATALVLACLPLALERAAAPAEAWRLRVAAVGETVDDERARAVVLPHRWADDCAGCRALWYRIDHPMPDLPGEAQAVVLPQLADNAAVYLNGRLLGQGGRFADPVARLGMRPLWLPAPAALWQAGDNRLYVLVKAARPGAGHMPAPAIGPEAELAGAWWVREALAVTLPQVLATAAIVLALMMGAMAWYRRREPGYRELAVAAALFGADTHARLFVEVPFAAETWDAVLLGQRGVLVVAVLWLVRSLARAARDDVAPEGARIADGTGRVPRRALCGPLAATGSAAVAAVLLASASFVPAASAVDVAEALARLVLGAAAMVLARDGWRRAEPRLLASGALLALACGIDLLRLPPLALPNALPAGLLPEPLPLVPWALAAMAAAAGWLLLVRFVETLNAAELLNIDLEALVHERTAELQAQFGRVRELERQQVVAAERERLMRDMHDGVGGHLVSILAMIEADRRRPGELATAVREALTDMRLMVDSLEPVDDDLNAVLAMFHDRLAPRLRASGVTLHWDVALLPAVPGLTPARVLHVLRILQEAVSNALRHGGARTLWMRAAAGPDGVEIELRDDGTGFAPDGVAGGRGLKNMQRRAQEAGAAVHIASRPGDGCRVSLRLPLVGSAGEGGPPPPGAHPAAGPA